MEDNVTHAIMWMKCIMVNIKGGISAALLDNIVVLKGV